MTSSHVKENTKESKVPVVGLLTETQIIDPEIILKMTENFFWNFKYYSEMVIVYSLNSDIKLQSNLCVAQSAFLKCKEKDPGPDRKGQEFAPVKEDRSFTCLPTSVSQTQHSNAAYDKGLYRCKNIRKLLDNMTAIKKC